MTDLKNQVPNQQTAPNVSAQPAKENIMSKIGGGLAWWVGSLTGHPQARKPVVKQPAPPVTNQVPSQPQQTPATSFPQGTASTEGDSVAGDLDQLKKLVGKFSTNVNKSVGPVVQKGLKTSTLKASAFGRSNQKFLRTVMKIFFILILLIIVAFIGMQFFKKLPGGVVGNATPTPEENGISVTPTPIVYNPTKPSIYADDPVILKLGEDIDVLVREISGTNIKETQLNPPVLDFSISF